MNFVLCSVLNVIEVLVSLDFDASVCPRYVAAIKKLP